MARLKTHFRDTGLKALEKRVERLTGGPHAKVGVLSSKGGAAEAEGGEGVTVAEIAEMHEFGTSRLPERSFIRASLAQRESEIGAMAGKLTGQVIENKIAPGRVLDILGAYAAGEIKKFIASGQVRPEEKPATKEAKNRRAGKAASSKTVTLADTGQLLNSIGHEVVS